MRNIAYKFACTQLLSMIAEITYAAPSDHGRWYDENGTGETLSTFIGWIIFIALVILGVMLLVNNATNGDRQRKNGNTSPGNIGTRSSCNNTKKVYSKVGLYSDPCPKCCGRGWINGRELRWDENGYHICSYCKGHGRIMSESALSISKGLEQTRNENALTKAFSKIRLEQELEKCALCPHCQGKGRIKDFDVVENNLDGKKYTKEICDKCHGIGRLYYN